MVQRQQNTDSNIPKKDKYKDTLLWCCSYWRNISQNYDKQHLAPKNDLRKNVSTFPYALILYISKI